MTEEAGADAKQGETNKPIPDTTIGEGATKELGEEEEERGLMIRSWNGEEIPRGRLPRTYELIRQKRRNTQRAQTRTKDRIAISMKMEMAIRIKE